MRDLNEIRKAFAETYARLFSPLTIFIFFACWILAVTAGPFGTYEAMGWELRAIYWFSIVSLAILIGFGVRALMVVVVGYERPLLFDFGATLTMTAIFSPIAIMLRQIVSRSADGLVVDALSIMFNTFFITAAIFVLRRHVTADEPGSYLFPELEPEPEPNVPRLMRRLSAEVKAPILRLSARDHYVDVVTERGEQALRLRLVDAIDEMEPVKGFCTHRSHWVAQTAIAGTERENSHKLFVILINGDSVPVSRKYRPDLEQAGIVPRD